MPSYAAVMAWPFNSVTNLLFLWKPPDYKSCCAVWGPFLKSSAPVLCLMTVPVLAFWSKSFIGSEGEVTYFTQLRHSRGETRFCIRLVVKWQKAKRELLSTFTAGRRLRVLFLLITSFCLCHQGFKSRRSEQVDLQRKCWRVNILIHCLIFSWEFNHLS